MTPMGVKIRRENGRYQYQPPSLKFTCVRVLDQNFPDKCDSKMYWGIQSCIDTLINTVENHLIDLELEGITEHSTWIGVEIDFSNV